MHDAAVWGISAATIAAIVSRPLRISEWIWAVAGAAVLVAAHLLSGHDAASAARDGVQVYAFLLGMLALAELARAYRVFDWNLAVLIRGAHGSTAKLFTRFFAIAVGVTALLSNDGTIVLLTPAALALSARAGVAVLPFAYAVAFVANAASFILPISNPANLVVFSRLPALGPWLAVFAAPSAAAIACTYVVLRLRFTGSMREPHNSTVASDQTSPLARYAGVVVGFSLLLLVAAAALTWPLGYVALGVGAASVLLVGLRDRRAFGMVARQAPWSIVPLVAGLFVIVRALDATGVLEAARSLFRHTSHMPPLLGQLATGAAVTLADALLNNLPTGVIARYALHAQGVASHVVHAVLVGIDLGPNLSLSGSLATLLWVMLLRREGIEVSARHFLAMGALVTIPSLALALITLV